MKKIGIITFHNVQNAGAMLQAFALKKYLETKGYEVYFIDYIQKKLLERNAIYRNPFRRAISNYRHNKNPITFLKIVIHGIITNMFFLRRLSVQKIFDEFRQKNFKIMALELIASTHFYALIAGSDQIWNSNLIGGSLDPIYFLSFSDINALKISYAASAGGLLSEKDLLVLPDLLKNLDYISVREKELAEQISPFTDKPVYTVLDPTLLLKKEEWLPLINKKFTHDPYIFLYVLEENRLLYKTVEYLSKKYKLKIVELGFKKRTSSTLVKHYDPFDFLSIIQNADYIVTNSFHGAVFSIVFEKQFIIIPHSTRNTRLENLLKSVDLLDRVIHEDSNLDMLGDISHFSEIKNKLNVLKESSENYLKMSLKHDKD